VSIVVKVLVYLGFSTLEVGVGRILFCYKEIGAMPLNISGSAALRSKGENLLNHNSQTPIGI